MIEDITEFEKVTLLQRNQDFTNSLLRSFSHELRTPFNSAMGYLQSALLGKLTNMWQQI